MKIVRPCAVCGQPSTAKITVWMLLTDPCSRITPFDVRCGEHDHAPRHSRTTKTPAQPR